MEKAVRITTNINVKELYEFTMIHNYKAFHGLVGLMFSIASAIGGAVFWDKLTTTNKVLIVIFALTFTVLEPIGCYLKVRKQIRKNFSKPIEYEMSSKCIKIRQGDGEAECYWYEVMKVTSTKHLINIYTSPARAFIIPKKDIGDKFHELRRIIMDNAECRRVDVR